MNPSALLPSPYTPRTVILSLDTAFIQLSMPFVSDSAGKNIITDARIPVPILLGQQVR